jgi:peptide/nickel transport system permease protein
LFLVIFLIFAILNLIPGDPGRMHLGIEATQEAVDMFNRQFGLDKPFLTRFTTYVTGIATRFDFGLSYRTREAVMPAVLSRVPPTFAIALFGVSGAVLFGVPLGVLAAIKRSTLTDTNVTALALLLSAIPNFWLGLMLLQLFSVVLSILPTYGASSWKSFILPSVALALPGSSGFIRLARATMLDVVHQEYITTARAKGAPEYSVIWRHAFRNAALPLINGAGLMFAGLLGGAVIIEAVFSLPGLGRLMVTAIQQRDIPIVMGCAIFLSFVFMAIILIIDLIYAALDPRIKLRYQKGGK